MNASGRFLHGSNPPRASRLFLFTSNVYRNRLIAYQSLDFETPGGQRFRPANERYVSISGRFFGGWKVNRDPNRKSFPSLGYREKREGPRLLVKSRQLSFASAVS